MANCACEERCLFNWYEEVEQARYSEKGQLLSDLLAYDRIICSSSGGKDSLASILYLLEIGVPKDKIFIWHQAIDGNPETDPPFMDWPITDSYVRAVGEALGIKTEFQWRKGGFYTEMMRQKARTADVQYQYNDQVVTLPTTKGKYSTRRKFPAKAMNLRTRFCSSSLKIDVCRRVLNNHPDYKEGRYLVITGERREESYIRAKYLNVEQHPCTTKKRHVTWWRSVLEWSEQEIWDIIERNRVYPHMAYQLGFSRTSCLGCIFSSCNQWAIMREIAPQRFNNLVQLEKDLNFTIDNKYSLTEMADRGNPNFDWNSNTTRLVAKALAKEPFTAEDVFVQKWELPAGAFKGSAGGSLN
jgi:3'-phosphoadenosine 5'-phosphosulfate sulfotransferase (PAPS reductase)/FAD synthetase